MAREAGPEDGDREGVITLEESLDVLLTQRPKVSDEGGSSGRYVGISVVDDDGGLLYRVHGSLHPDRDKEATAPTIAGAIELYRAMAVESALGHGDRIGHRLNEESKRLRGYQDALDAFVRKLGSK